MIAGEDSVMDTQERLIEWARKVLSPFQHLGIDINHRLDLNVAIISTERERMVPGELEKGLGNLLKRTGDLIFAFSAAAFYMNVRRDTQTNTSSHVGKLGEEILAVVTILRNLSEHDRPSPTGIG